MAYEALGEERLFVVGHDWGRPTAFAFAAQHRGTVRRMAIFDVPVPGDGTPVMFSDRWHHGLHWERDLPEELTAGREDAVAHAKWPESAPLALAGLAPAAAAHPGWSPRCRARAA